MQKYKAVITIIFLSISLFLFIGWASSKSASDRVDKTIAAEKMAEEAEKQKTEEAKKQKAETEMLRLEEERKAQEEAARLAEEQRIAEEARKAEEQRIAEEQKKAEEEAQRVAAEKQKAEEAAAQKRAEDQKKAEEAARLAAEKKKAQEEAAKTPPPAEPTLEERLAATSTAQRSNQIILVINKRLYLMNKDGNGNWTKVFECDAWHGSRGFSSNRTEGDKTTPTGSFPIMFAFGTSNPGTQLEFRQITPTSHWSSSRIDPSYYNRWYEGTDPVYTEGGERLADYQKQYKYAMVIGFNWNQVVGKGSAIFLHVDGGNKVTEGCVSVTESNMLYLMQNVRPGAQIIITTGADNLKYY
ncbi:L,D-transpeptidase family protein [Alloiococcus sp. CFN-8]|uniref:L,D-transpeptidase family protein n=1 Tax=Alloiococcus sp. CFN-8 TaxID=3416081 RepID=UPI003CEB2B3E